MNKRDTILSAFLIIVFLCIGSKIHSIKTDDLPLSERKQLVEEEGVIFEYMLDRISHHSSVPTKEELEKTFSFPIEDDSRARLSAKLYYERGIIGALLCDHEREVLHFLLGHQRRPNSLGELADRIRNEFYPALTTLQALRTLQFLYKAGYIEVRDDGKRVHLIIPHGFENLYLVSSIEKAKYPADPFEKAMAEAANTEQQEKTIPPVIIEIAKHDRDQQQAESSPQTPNSPNHLPDTQSVYTTTRPIQPDKVDRPDGYRTQQDDADTSSPGPSASEGERYPADPFEKAMADVSDTRQEEKTVAPVRIERPENSRDQQQAEPDPKTPRSPDHAPEMSSEHTPALETQPEKAARPDAYRIPKDETQTSSPEPSAKDGSRSPAPQLQQAQDVKETELSFIPEHETAVADLSFLGPPSPHEPFIQSKEQSQREQQAGFNTEIMKEREKYLLPCAPDFWGWPYLYGQDNFEILTSTTDTGSDVHIIVEHGILNAYTPRDVVVFNEGQHGDVLFFRSEQNVRVWTQEKGYTYGEIMTLPEAITWARNVLHGQSE